MKSVFYSAILATLLYSCAPKMSSTITKPQSALADSEFVLVLHKEDVFKNDGIEIGSIKSTDNGFSTKCTYYEVLDELKQMARKNGANLIKITDLKNPDQWSTCARVKASIYKVPNYRTHETEIEWTAGRKLTWEDFKGAPKAIYNHNAAAVTYCGFGFQAGGATMFSKIKIFTVNTFSTKLSWVRADQQYRPDLLVHEQGHFDLCEVYTRQLRKKMEEKKLTAFNLNTEAKVIFKAVYASYLQRQELYEQETEHGLDSLKQQDWNSTIAAELTDLGSFVR